MSHAGGRPRLPRSERAIRGTSKKSREEKYLAGTAVGYSTRVPPPPKKLSSAERAVWVEVAAAVDSLHVFAVSDTLAFRLLVEAITVERALYARGAWAEWGKATGVVLRLFGSFGLTPSDRHRVAAVVAPPEAEPVKPGRDDFKPIPFGPRLVEGDEAG